MAMHDYALEERTIGRILAEKADRIADKTFLLWQGRSYSYGEPETMTNRYANGFSAHGIGHGDHVAVILPNCPEFYWITWGLGKLGAVSVPINTAAKGEMLRYFIDQSDATCVVVDDEWAERVASIAPQLPKVTRYFYRGDKAAGSGLGTAEVPVVPLKALESRDASRPPLNAVAHDDTQLIMYTSGTTGPSKGVMCPHRKAMRSAAP